MKITDEIIEHVVQTLNSKGISVDRSWIVESLEYVSLQNGLSNDIARLTDKIYNLFLDSDLHECYERQITPKTIQSMHKVTLFEGHLEVFQIDEIANIGASLQDKQDKENKNKDPNGPVFVGGKPLLKLFLTDGVNNMVGFDLSGLCIAPNGVLMVTAGCKVALKAVQVRRGVLMLHGGCCQILGGEVSRLKTLQSQCKPVSVADAPPSAPSTAVSLNPAPGRPPVSYSYQITGNNPPSSAAVAAAAPTLSLDDSLTVMEEDSSQQQPHHSSESYGSVEDSGGGGSGGGGDGSEPMHDSHSSFEYEGDSFDYGDYYANAVPPTSASQHPYSGSASTGIAFEEAEGQAEDSGATLLPYSSVFDDDHVSSQQRVSVDLVTPSKPQDSHSSTGDLFDSPLPSTITSRRRRTTTATKARPSSQVMVSQEDASTEDSEEIVMREIEQIRQEQNQREWLKQLDHPGFSFGSGAMATDIVAVAPSPVAMSMSMSEEVPPDMGYSEELERMYNAEMAAAPEMTDSYPVSGYKDRTEYWDERQEAVDIPQDSQVTTVGPNASALQSVVPLVALVDTSFSGCVRVRGVFSRVHCFSVDLDPFKYYCLVELKDQSGSCIAELASDFCLRFLEVSMEDFMVMTDCGDPHTSSDILQMFQQRFVDTRGCFWVESPLPNGFSGSASSGGGRGDNVLCVGRVPSGGVKLRIVDYAPDDDG